MKYLPVLQKENLPEEKRTCWGTNKKKYGENFWDQQKLASAK